MKEIINRSKAPTPKFFRILRNIGLSMAAASGAILAAPVALPAALITAAGYVLVAGTVLGAVSQTATETEAEVAPKAATKVVDNMEKISPVISQKAALRKVGVKAKAAPKKPLRRAKVKKDGL